MLLDDGRALYDPSIAQLAEALGLTQPATRDRYDLVVVGGGPAGLSAAVAAACDGLTVVVIEDDCPGGQAAGTVHLEDHLGYPAGLTGADFAHRALAQAKRLGVQWCSAQGRHGADAPASARTGSYSATSRRWSAAPSWSPPA